MRTIVTGGAGFIGSHLTERLLTEGHQVTVLDNFSTGRQANLKHMGKRRKLKVYTVDIASDPLERYFRQVDWVFHLAALADIVPSIEKPWDYHNSNVSGTLRVLEASRQAKVKRFVYAASSSCYGIPKIYPTPETAPVNPMYPYALTKNIAEQYLFHWGKIYKLPVTSLRFFNVYGPRSRTSGAYGAVFGVFLTQKLRGQAFTVVGDGAQTRDFVFVGDVAEALLLAAKHPKAVGEIFNIGTGRPVSVNYLVKLLKGKTVHVPKRPGEPDRAQADITKIKRYLGWKPKTTIEEGVKILLANINYWKEAPLWTPAKIHRATKKWFECLQ